MPFSTIAIKLRLVMPETNKKTQNNNILNIERRQEYVHFN